MNTYSVVLNHANTGVPTSPATKIEIGTRVVHMVVDEKAMTMWTQVKTNDLESATDKAMYRFRVAKLRVQAPDLPATSLDVTLHE